MLILFVNFKIIFYSGSVSPVHSINSTSTLTGEDSTYDDTSPDQHHPSFMLPVSASTTSSSSSSSCGKIGEKGETEDQVKTYIEIYFKTVVLFIRD